ncbi:MAG: DUF2796 domain-containing protein [Gammaproteobacteria bacterium]|nr:DUF2796 domain-containing protein [Gammaproteobacteria bacterium]
MIRNALLSALSITLSIVTSTAAAQSAHVHGEGRGNIAIDGNRIFMALEFPGADIVGFEHEVRSSDEKAAVVRAIAQLGDPMQLLRFEADASCEVRAATAKAEGGHEEHDREEHAEHDEHDEHENEEHAGHDQHEDEETHGTFVAEYEFECASISALGFIEFIYFSLFNNAQSLDIVLIDGKGQRRTEIDRANPVLQL